MAPVRAIESLRNADIGPHGGLGILSRVVSSDEPSGHWAHVLDKTAQWSPAV